MKPEYNPGPSLQKYDLSINQLYLFLNRISINVYEQLQQLKLRQCRVSDGSLQFLFSMYSSISLLYLRIFFCLCYTDINWKSKEALKTLSRYWSV